MGLKEHADKQCGPSATPAVGPDEAQQPLLPASELSRVDNPYNKLSWTAKPFVIMVLNLIYAEALGLYGFIVGLLIAVYN